MPSTTLPAAATGLPTRRTALLASLAGLGTAVSLPKVARAAEASTPGVADLARRHALAAAAHLAANDACEDAEDRVVYPNAPEALFRQANDILMLGGLGRRHGTGRWWYGDEDIVAYLRSYRTENESTAEQVHARAAEIVRAYDGWQTDRKAAEDVAGVTAANETFSVTFIELDAIQRQIVGLRSPAPDVLRLKVAVAQFHCTAGYIDHGIRYALEHYGPDEAVALSILRDVIDAQRTGGAA